MNHLAVLPEGEVGNVSGGLPGFQGLGELRQGLFTLSPADKVCVRQALLRANGGMDSTPNNRNLQLLAQIIAQVSHPFKTVGHQGDADQPAALTMVRDIRQQLRPVAIILVPQVIHFFPVIRQKEQVYLMPLALQGGGEATEPIGGYIGIRGYEGNFQDSSLSLSRFERSNLQFSEKKLDGLGP